MILKFLLIAIAAIGIAFTNTISLHKGGKLKGKFWDINQQGNFIPFTKYPLDGYHLMQTLYIFAFCVAIFGFHWQLAVAGAIYIFTFNWFWNKILNKKN